MALESVKLPTALVLGGAGFLGSHLCDWLLAEGWNVCCVDNLSTGSRANLAKALKSPSFRLVIQDILEPIDIRADRVFNLACAASPPRYQSDPVHTLKTSILGVLNAIEASARAQARLLHTSTSEVYGDPEVHPQPESYRGSVNPIGPRACYDEGKRAAETLLFDHHRRHGLNIAVCRIFNTYGPRMDPFDGRVVSNFIYQALTGLPITIYGDGSQTRSFCFVDDLIEGIMQLMAAPDSVTGPINLGNPDEFTVLELAEVVQELVGRKVEIAFKPLPVDDPTRRRPDISRAERELGWAPRVALRDGLGRTIDYFDDLIRSGRVEMHAEENRQRFGHSSAA